MQWRRSVAAVLFYFFNNSSHKSRSDELIIQMSETKHKMTDLKFQSREHMHNEHIILMFTSAEIFNNDARQTKNELALRDEHNCQMGIKYCTRSACLSRLPALGSAPLINRRANTRRERLFPFSGDCSTKQGQTATIVNLILFGLRFVCYSKLVDK